MASSYTLCCASRFALGEADLSPASQLRVTFMGPLFEAVALVALALGLAALALVALSSPLAVVDQLPLPSPLICFDPLR